MRNVYCFLLMLVVFTSCIKEKYTILQSFLVNNTVHRIKILPYKYGVGYSSDTISIAPGQSFEFGYTHVRGFSTQGAFYSEYYNCDSMQVIFNDSFKVVHYFWDAPANPPIKFLPKTSNRNLFNYLSFEYNSEDKKSSRINTYTYRFVQSDYDFAKN